MLAEPGTPLKLADGTMIDPATGRARRLSSTYVEVPSHSKAQEQIRKINTRLADIPMLPKQLNVVSAILSYTLIGLGDDEIATATGLTKKQITTVRTSEVYEQLQKKIVDNIADQDETDVRTYLVKHARKAAENVVDLLEAEDEKVSLAASKDILDRSGQRPVDTVNHIVEQRQTLNIVHIKRDETIKPPELDLTVTDVKDENDGNGS